MNNLKIKLGKELYDEIWIIFLFIIVLLLISLHTRTKKPDSFISYLTYNTISAYPSSHYMYITQPSHILIGNVVIHMVDLCNFKVHVFCIRSPYLLSI